MNPIFKIFLPLLLIGIYIELPAQKTFIQPFNPDRDFKGELTFIHPQVGDRVLSMMNKLVEIEPLTKERYNQKVSFTHKDIVGLEGSESLEKLTATELSQLRELGQEAIDLGDSIAIFLSYTYYLISYGPFFLQEYNTNLEDGRIFSLDPISKDWGRYGIFKPFEDTVYLSQGWGNLTELNYSKTDTLYGNSLHITFQNHELKPAHFPQLPSRGVFTAFHAFRNDGSIFRVYLNYVILPKR